MPQGQACRRASMRMLISSYGAITPAIPAFPTASAYPSASIQNDLPRSRSFRRPDGRIHEKLGTLAIKRFRHVEGDIMRCACSRRMRIAGDVRSGYDVGQLEQRVVGVGRLGCKSIETGASDPMLFQTSIE